MNDSKKSHVPLIARFSTQLFVLISLVFIPALILTIHTNLKERKAKKQHTRDGIIATAKLAAAKQQNFVANAEQLLATVSQFSFLVSNSDRGFSEIHFANLLKLSPEYLDVGLIGADGTLFCSTVLTNVAPNLSAWSCFKRVLQTHKFSIGDFGTNGTIREETLDFGYPIFDEKKTLTRVLYASLDLNRLRKAATQIDLPAGANVTVFDNAGNVLVRHGDTHAESFLGKSMAHHAYVQQLLRDNDNVFETRGLDKVDRQFAVATVGDGAKKRLWISVGIPTKTLFADANQALWENISIMTLIALLALVVAYFYAEHFFLRPLYSLIAEARSLASGSWDAHSAPLKGKGELSELSRSFNEMAVALEKHRQEIEMANAQLEQRVRDRTLQLEQAGQELEAFSYSVSHDLRAPLRHISGFIELLSGELGDSITQKSRRFLNIIADSAKQMGQLIDELLVFSKMGRVEMQKSVVNTAQLLEETIANLEPELRGRNIVWKKSLLPNLQVDPAMLRQVFVNLISNAIKYSQPRDPACIEIGHEENGGEIIVFVRDNGVGFDMQFAGKLFGVFQRLHQSDEFEGTGIGLANVRRIIQRHGGRTWAEGTLGEGATFYFSLPKLES